MLPNIVTIFTMPKMKENEANGSSDKTIEAIIFAESTPEQMNDSQT